MTLYIIVLKHDVEFYKIAIENAGTKNSIPNTVFCQMFRYMTFDYILIFIIYLFIDIKL